MPVNQTIARIGFLSFAILSGVATGQQAPGSLSEVNHTLIDQKQMAGAVMLVANRDEPKEKVDDTFAALGDGGKAIVLNQDFGADYLAYNGFRGDVRRVYDARKATWKFENYPRPMKQGYPIRIGLLESGTWCGGSVLGTMDTTVGWKRMYFEGGNGNSAAFAFGKPSAPNFTIDGLRAHNVWDGIRACNETQNFRIQNCWLSYVRDDAVENDYRYSGTIDDCLFDGVFVGISARPGSGSSPPDRSNEVITMTNSLMRLEILPGPPGKNYWKPHDGHMGFTKWSAEGAPKLSLMNNIFMLEQLPWNGVSALQFPQGDPGKLADSENNIIVWLGEGKYPGEVQPGFKVVTDRSVWDNAKAKWIADHPRVARFPFDPPG